MDVASQHVVYNRTRGICLGSEVELACSAYKRMKGLLGRRAEDFRPGKGLWIQSSGGVHTFGMKFPIDVAYLDSNGRILRAYHGLMPFRIAALSPRTRSILELPAGTLMRTGTQIGDVLEICRHSNSEP